MDAHASQLISCFCCFFSFLFYVIALDRCSSVSIGVKVFGGRMSDRVADLREVDLSKPPAEGMVRVTFLPRGQDGGVCLQLAAL